jgi:hypothetical protein
LSTQATNIQHGVLKFGVGELQQLAFQYLHFEIDLVHKFTELHLSLYVYLCCGGYWMENVLIVHTTQGTTQSSRKNEVKQCV